MRSLAELRAWAEQAPEGAMVPASSLLDVLDRVGVVVGTSTPATATEQPWRVTFWTCPAEVRISRDELLEVVGRPVTWLYRLTSEKAADRIPHRKLDGELVFVVGEVRRWLRDREDIVRAGPLDRPALMAG